MSNKPDFTGRTAQTSPLTPEALEMILLIAEEGSFAAAARALGRVPSALTYSIRQLEEALDVLLFDRSSRQARLTAAGEELVREARRLLWELEQVGQRIRRISTGWETDLVIAVDAAIQMPVVMDLLSEFQGLAAPTRIRLLQETLSGTWEAIARGRADLAIGAIGEIGPVPGLKSEPLGHLPFCFAVAPQHPLASAREPLRDDEILKYTAVVVADSARQGAGMSVGVLAGQSTLTVPSIEAKRMAQLRGLGVGYLPLPMVEEDLREGRLVRRQLDRPERLTPMGYAWKPRPMSAVAEAAVEEASGRFAPPGPAIAWWLERLANPTTRQALIG